MAYLAIDENGQLVADSGYKPKKKKQNQVSLPKPKEGEVSSFQTSSYNLPPAITSSKQSYSAYKQSEKKLDYESNLLKNKYNNAGIVTGSGTIPSNDRQFYLKQDLNNHNYAQMKEDYNNKRYGSSRLIAASEREKENSRKYKEFSKQPDVVEQTNKVNNLYDETANNYYKYLQDKVAEDDVNWWDKTGGQVVRGMISPFTVGRYSLKNEKGQSFIMPTYDDLKTQKVNNSYETWFGKLVGPAAHEIGKLATSTGMNALVPGSGAAGYYSNIYMGQLNNAIAEGYDSKSAAVYATLGSALEYYSGKILGGTTNAIFGTGSSELSNSISRGLSKVITNHPRIVSALSNAISEGSEEFIQEYLDRINKAITLGSKDKIFTKETFEDAVYSASIGMITGGAVGSVSPNEYSTRKSSLNTQINNKNNNINELLEKRNNNLADINKVNKIDNKILQNQKDINNLTTDLNNYYKKNINLPKVNNEINITTNQSNLSENLIKEINNKTYEANKNKSNIEFANINDILPLKNNGGFRTEEQINNLENAIRKNGITNPIELIKKADGTIEISNGNHRLEVAQKLGLKEVPIKFVGDYVANDNKIDYNKNQENLNFIKGEEDGGFRSIKRIEKDNDSTQSIIRSGIGDSIISNEGRSIRGNDEIHSSLVGYNNRPSSGTTRQENTTQRVGTETKTGELDNSSFNLSVNEDTQNIKIPTSADINQTQNNNDISLPNSLKVRKTEIQDKVNKRLRNRSYKIINEATKSANAFINFDKNEKQYFKEELNKYVGKSKNELQNAKTYQEVKQIVEKFANREVNFINEEIDSIKKEIKSYKIKVDDYIKSNMDYNEFKQNNFGKLKLGNDGTGIDSIWQELSEAYPNYFDKSVVNEFDMLETLSDFMNQSSIITEEYRLNDFEINSATNRILDKLINNSLSKQEIDEMQTYLEDKYSIRTREMVQQEILKEMNIKIEDLDIGKDIGSIAYQRTDPIRLNEKVFGFKIGQKINDATINKTKHNEAERTRFLNKEREEIKALNIKAYSKESAAVQKFAEKFYVGKDGKKYTYSELDLINEFPDIKTQEKIKHAAEILRSKYDTYIDSINEVITSLGYDAIPKRNDYMHHFQELDSKFTEWGLPLSNLNDENLPTDINGLTDQFKPGKNYFAAAMERKGMKTSYDAITGVDKYLEGASNLIYHTKDIQRYRALSKLIRETYGQQHGMDNMNKFTAEQFSQRLEDIYNGKLSKYVAWLDEQANSLAGKKGAIDRGAERVLGRKVYTVLDTAKKQVGSNMTGFNVRSSLTNFASAIQGASKTNKLAFLKGTISTFKNIIHKDNLIDKSDFLTSRFGSNQLSQKKWQKASNAGQIFMSGSDYFTANQIWRSKYYENLSKGMNEKQAIKQADDFSARIMGDRSKGTTAEIFNSKTLGLFTQFQLEVNNQWSSMIHDNKVEIQNGNKTKMAVFFQLGQLAAASYLFNNLMKALTGSSVMFDPIDMLKKLIGADDEDEEKTLDKRAFEVFGDFMDNIPMASIFTGGRVPISEAFTGVSTAFKKITNQKDEYGNDITYDDIKNDMISSAFYWLLPTGYGQIRKTVKGSSMYDKKLPLPGSYTNSGNLRFNADDSTSGRIKAILFGQYSSEESQKYIDSGYKSINKNYIKEMKELKMSSSEYRNYRNGLSASGKKTLDKANYINSLELSYKEKNIMLSNILYDEKNQNKLKSINELEMSDLDKNKYFTAQAKISEVKSDKDEENKNKKISDIILNTNLSDKNMAHLYGNYYSKEETLDNLINMNIPIKEFIKFNSENITSDYNAKTGKTISGSKKNKVINYINSLKLTIPQKAILIKSQYNSYKDYDNEIINYVNKINISANEKKMLLRSIGFNNYNSDIVNHINSQNISKIEKEKKLKSLGFTIRDGRVYW